MTSDVCSGRDDEQKYQNFIKDVTSDILRSGIYTNRSEELIPLQASDCNCI